MQCIVKALLKFRFAFQELYHYRWPIIHDYTKYIYVWVTCTRIYSTMHIEQRKGECINPVPFAAEL